MISDDCATGRAGLISHALDWRTREDRAERKQRHLDTLTRLGFEIVEIDLLGEQPAETMFDDLDLVWVAGGSTFCLSYAFSCSQAAAPLRNALEAGLVYAGESAGGIITTRSISFLAPFDDPNVARSRVDDGLGLVDFVVLPHWQAEGHVESGRAMLADLTARGITTYQLRDGDDLTVTDGVVELSA